MVLIILGISVVALISGIFIYCKFGGKLWNSDMEWVYYSLNFTGAILTTVSLIAVLALCIDYSTRTITNNKIALYREENAKIEQQICKIVNDYMEYKTSVFEKVTPDESITYVTLFPELKSDSLVNKQMELYMENMKEIKQGDRRCFARKIKTTKKTILHHITIIQLY